MADASRGIDDQSRGVPVRQVPSCCFGERGANAKSPKERHDTAYFAWEASVRLGVAARPPGERASHLVAGREEWA
jgi:hypothetical protein